jgi:hypothetical protein
VVRLLLPEKELSRSLLNAHNARSLYPPALVLVQLWFPYQPGEALTESVKVKKISSESRLVGI